MLSARFENTPDALAPRLTDAGCAVLAPDALCQLTGLDRDRLEALRPFWADLPADLHLRDGGHYRSRRHACYTVEPRTLLVEAAPRRAHWQPLDYNALHGGIERWFEPLAPALVALPAWSQLVARLGRLFSSVRACERWFVEAHQFRIDTSGGIGRPTPEGAHRDGVDFVAVVLIDRQGIKGGETRVFEADGPSGIRFTLAEPFSALLLDDRRVIHETSPIQPTGARGFRDTLVLTYRSGGFQSPE